MNHDPNCCDARGCHPNVCSSGRVQADGSLLCGTWRSLPDADLARNYALRESVQQDLKTTEGGLADG